MCEIGGYIELDKYTLPMLHDKAIKLNCGRNALAYLIEAKRIESILMPKFMCDSCNGILKRYGVSVRYYSIDLNFRPIDIILKSGGREWLYLVNFYGQLSNEYIKKMQMLYRNIIVDQAQAYFQKPVVGVDTLYTCRKFFGVADGAILYSDKELRRTFEQDESFERMHFLLGRFERTASEFYPEYAQNNDFFINEPIKKMSKLTENLLHGIDYEIVKKKREKNFETLHDRLKKINKLKLTVPEGAFMYPLYVENGDFIRRELQKKKIYIPILWPDVFEICDESELEFDMAKNILPLPIDQRYDLSDMELLSKEVMQYIG